MPQRDRPSDKDLVKTRNFGSMLRVGRPPDLTPPDLTPDASEIVVDGRSPIQFWGDREKRSNFMWFCLLAESFGLVVHELQPGAGIKARRRWARVRVDSEHAYAVIRDGGRDGILFDEWLKLWLGDAEPNDTLLKAARAKAGVALTRLYENGLGRVEKIYAPDGRLILRSVLDRNADPRKTIEPAESKA